MAQLSSSSGVKDALGNLSELVDDIWFYAGDKSVDSNWYTKRMLLASIYKTTELFMLQDESEGSLRELFDTVNRGGSGLTGRIGAQAGRDTETKCLSRPARARRRDSPRQS